MKVLGLTGGVGMGKTAAAEILQNLGASVVDTDALARLLVQPGPALSEIRESFGSNVFNASGELLRDELARIVFSNPAERAKLERILHPRIRSLWKQQLQTWCFDQKPMAVVVIPLLFETAAEAEFDAVVCIASSAATQRQRLKERGWNDQQIDQRIASQWPIEKKMALSDFVVWNEAGLDVLAAQLQRVIR